MYSALPPSEYIDLQVCVAADNTTMTKYAWSNRHLPYSITRSGKRQAGALRSQSISTTDPSPAEKIAISVLPHGKNMDDEQRMLDTIVIICSAFLSDLQHELGGNAKILRLLRPGIDCNFGARDLPLGEWIFSVKLDRCRQYDNDNG